MKSIFIGALFLIAHLPSAVWSDVAKPAAKPSAELQICDSKTENGYIQIMKGTGDAARTPTLEELFDALNSTSTLLADLKYEDNRKSQPLVYIEVPGKAPVYYDCVSVPKKTKGDPRCRNREVTGYECRLAQLRGVEETGGMPNGIKTGVQIKIPVSDSELVFRVSKAFGCGEIVEKSGKPLLRAVQEKTPAARPAAKAPAKAAAAHPAGNAPVKAPVKTTVKAISPQDILEGRDVPASVKTAPPSKDVPASVMGAPLKPKPSKPNLNTEVPPSNVIPVIQLHSVPAATSQ